MLIGSKVLNIFFIFIVLTLIGMLVTYISITREKMSSLIKENFNLFDKMHEGLIVLDQADETLQFVSQPAINLLKQIPDMVGMRPDKTVDSEGKKGA